MAPTPNIASRSQQSPRSAQRRTVGEGTSRLHRSPEGKHHPCHACKRDNFPFSTPNGSSNIKSSTGASSTRDSHQASMDERLTNQSKKPPSLATYPKCGTLVRGSHPTSRSHRKNYCCTFSPSTPNRPSSGRTFRLRLLQHTDSTSQGRPQNQQVHKCGEISSGKIRLSTICHQTSSTLATLATPISNRGLRHKVT